MSFLTALYTKWVKPLWTAVTRIAATVIQLIANLFTKVAAWHQHKLATDPRYAVALVTLGGAIGRIVLPIQWVIGFIGDLMREIFRKIDVRTQHTRVWDPEEDLDGWALPNGALH